MKQKIEKEIALLESKIASHQYFLQDALDDFRKAASSYDFFNVIEFIPGKVKRIENHYESIKALVDKKSMLESLLGKDEEN